MRTIVALICVVSCAAVFVGGCSSPPAPPEFSPGPEFRDRTSPENVMYNLELAYEEMNAEEYLDCLSVDFIFYPDENDVQNPDLEIPAEWYKTDEADLHENMFGDGSDVESISLILTEIDVQYEEGNPQDPLDDIYVYTEGVDLRVNLYGGLTYLATENSEFWMRVDTDQQGSGGELFWEIYRWYELGGRRGSGDREDVTWGAIKAVYRSTES